MINFLSVKLFIYPHYPFKLLKIDTVAWFAFAIFIFYIITWFIRNIDGRRSLPIAVILACTSGYSSYIGDVLCLSRIIVFYPFFLAGYLVSEEWFSAVVEDCRIKVLAVLFFAAAAAMSYSIGAKGWPSYISTLSLFRGRFPFSEINFVMPVMKALPGYIVRAVHILVAAILSLSFFSLVPAAESFITTLGERTLSAYILHMPFVYL